MPGFPFPLIPKKTPSIYPLINGLHRDTEDSGQLTRSVRCFLQIPEYSFRHQKSACNQTLTYLLDIKSLHQMAIPMRRARAYSTNVILC